VLGGEAGARLADLLGMPSSPSGLLWLVRLASDPALSEARIVGVDEWAKRKGHSYSTILVDLERHCPIDLVGGRTSEVLAAWLHAHPGIGALSRDRVQEYAEGGREGAPGAIQVADRWHLLRNVGDVLDRALARDQRLLQTATDTMPAAEEQAAPASGQLPRAEQDRQARRAQWLARYQGVKELRAQGMSISSIARSLGISRRTAQKVVYADVFPRRVCPVGPANPHRYERYLREGWDAGCQNVQQLWRKIHEQVTAALHRRSGALWQCGHTRRSHHPSPLPVLHPRAALRGYLCNQTTSSLPSNERNSMICGSREASWTNSMSSRWNSV